MVGAMRFRLQPRWVRAARAGKHLALVLALACQVVAGALGLVQEPSESAKASLQATMVLCLSGHHPGQDHAPPIHPHQQDQAVAASAQAASHSMAVIDDNDAPAPSSISPVFWASLPPARAPPARFAAASYPTGPPATLI
jgi:hypothetical protein